MNAYELSDRLIKPDCFREYIIDSVVMLRQQADELNKVIPQLVKANGIIENLRIRIAELENEIGTQAWLQTKPLSDEEIWKLSDMVLENSDVIGFARAIEAKVRGDK